MQPIDVFREMKRTWTADKYIRDQYYAPYGRSCAVGALRKISLITDAIFPSPSSDPNYSVYSEAYYMLKNKVVELYGEEIPVNQKEIPFINDGPDGYNRIMRAVDAILLEDARQHVVTSLAIPTGNEIVGIPNTVEETNERIPSGSTV